MAALRFSDRARGFIDADAKHLLSFRQHAHSLGWSLDQVEGMLDRFATVSHKAAEMELADRDSFVRWAAAELHLMPDQVNALADWSNSNLITDNPTIATESTPVQDRQRLREIEQIMKTDFHRYQRDGELREEMYQILARQAGDGPTTPATSATPAVTARGDVRSARRASIEAIMGNPVGAYWRGDQSEALRTEYRGLLEGPAQPTTEGT